MLKTGFDISRTLNAGHLPERIRDNSRNHGEYGNDAGSDPGHPTGNDQRRAHQLHEDRDGDRCVRRRQLEAGREMRHRRIELEKLGHSAPEISRAQQRAEEQPGKAGFGKWRERLKDHGIKCPGSIVYPAVGRACKSGHDAGRDGRLTLCHSPGHWRSMPRALTTSFHLRISWATNASISDAELGRCSPPRSRKRRRMSASARVRLTSLFNLSTMGAGVPPVVASPKNETT